MKLRMRRRSQGQALIEFALVVPVLIVLLGGLLDIGRAYSQAGVIANAARAGARTGISFPTDQNKIKSRVAEEATGSGVTIDTAAADNPSVITISTPNGTGSGQPITVKVTYKFTPLMGSLFGLTTVEITRECTMAILTGG